jgi:glycosyltransferase involved in cell wall biosynthesis
MAADPGRKISGVVDCWRRAGHEVKHICGGDLPHPATTTTSYGAPETFSKWYRRNRLLDPMVNSVSEAKDIVHDQRMARALKSLVGEWRPHVVWERSCRLHDAGLRIAARIGKPYVLEWKDNLVPYSLSLFRRFALMKEKHKNLSAHFVVVESGVLRDFLVNEGVEETKIMVAHNAVMPDSFSRSENDREDTRRALGAADDDVLVGYLGSYAFYHDTERLVRAARLLQDRGVKKVKIMMVGTGKHYEEVCRIVEQLNVPQSELRMIPPVRQGEVPAMLSALDIAVLPGSTDIICPIKVQEYMASGLPAIVPDYPCNREVIADGVTGMLFEPKNERALADKILVLAKDKNMRQHMGDMAGQGLERSLQ